MATAEGGCLCGAVRYEARTRPTRVTACHCRFCQKATGAPLHVAAVFAGADFSVTSGAPGIYDHASDSSGKRIRIYFCATCGTKLFLKLERFPGSDAVYGGTLDDPNGLAALNDISRHIFLNSGRKGMSVPAGSHVFFGHAVGPDDTPLTPTVLDTPYVIGVSDKP